jgi:hypothetical protein
MLKGRRIRGSKPLVDSFLGSRDMHVDVATRGCWMAGRLIKSTRHSERNYRNLNNLHGFDAGDLALREPNPLYVM